MRSISGGQWAWGVTVVVAFMVALIPAQSFASKRVPKLAFSPAEPFDSQPVTVSWRADQAPRSAAEYLVQLASGDQNSCASNALVKLKPRWKRKGAVVRVKLRPDSEPVWCADEKALLTVSTIDRAGRFKLLASARVAISDNSSTPNPDSPGQNAKMRVLDGSSLTVHVPGRPDRTSSVSGSIDARTSMLGSRINELPRLSLKSAALQVAGLPADPLCQNNGIAFPKALNVSTGRSTLVGLGTSLTYLTLVFAEDPLGLTGCQGPASPPELRPITLSGTSNPPLGQTTLRGTLADLRYSDGAEITITLQLVVSWDFSIGPVLMPH